MIYTHMFDSLHLQRHFIVRYPNIKLEKVYFRRSESQLH